MSDTKEIKQSKRGGARPGAGRKRSSPDRIAKGGPSKERAAAVHKAVLARILPESTKTDPVEAIMEIAEWAVAKWRETHDVEMATIAVDWLARAAPYIRPRLNAVEAKINVNVSVYERIERARARVIDVDAIAA